MFEGPLGERVDPSWGAGGRFVEENRKLGVQSPDGGLHSRIHRPLGPPQLEVSLRSGLPLHRRIVELEPTVEAGCS